MREILFRGKKMTDKEWVVGSLLKFEDGDSYICTQDRCADVLNKYQVHSETVEQYIGLDDKNGDKIFKGDIIKDTKDNDELLVVEGDTLLGFDFRYIDGEDNAYTTAYDIGLSDDYTYLMSAVVIGNIYDNPELLVQE